MLLPAACPAEPAGQPLIHVRIWPEKSEYLLGEPTRITVMVRNLSGESLRVYRQGYYAVTSPREAERFSEDWLLADRPVDLAPHDSALYFVYPAHTASGKGRSYRRFRTFDRVGDYTIRVACRASVRKWTDVRDDADVILPLIWSNKIPIRVRDARRREARIFDALWDAHAVGNSYPRGSSLRRHSPEDENLKLLREVVDRRSTTPAMTYAQYALARMLLDPIIDYPIERPRELMECAHLLEDIQYRFPDFRPEEVSYYLALAYLRSEQSGARIGRSRREAEGIMQALLRKHPELRSHQKIGFLSQRVRETGDEIEVRLGMDKHEYVLGEPMLFRISLVNGSSHPTLGPGFITLMPGNAGFCGYLEIERPDGGRELWTEILSNAPSGDNRGIRLAPGDSLSIDLTYHLTAGPSDEWGYLRPTAKAFSMPGRYRISAGYGVPERLWRINGAGHMRFSPSTEVVVRAPNEQQAAVLDGLKAATKGTVLNAHIRDAAAFEAIVKMIDAHPAEPMTFYLRRAIAESGWLPLRGMQRDETRALEMLESLEKESHGLRQRELQLRRLDIFADLERVDRLTGAQRHDAEALIDELEASDPSLWTTLRFTFRACEIRLSDFGMGASYAAQWWTDKLVKEGPHPPSWDELREVAAAAPRRQEPIGPWQPDKHRGHRHHIYRH